MFEPMDRISTPTSELVNNAQVDAQYFWAGNAGRRSYGGANGKPQEIAIPLVFNGLGVSSRSVSKISKKQSTSPLISSLLSTSHQTWSSSQHVFLTLYLLLHVLSLLHVRSTKFKDIFEVLSLISSPCSLFFDFILLLYRDVYETATIITVDNFLHELS